MRSGSPLKGRGVHDGVREGLTSTAFAVFCCCASPFLYSFQFPLPYSSIWCCLCNALFIKSLVRKGFGSEGRNGQKKTQQHKLHTVKSESCCCCTTQAGNCVHRGRGSVTQSFVQDRFVYALGVALARVVGRVYFSSFIRSENGDKF